MDPTARDAWSSVSGVHVTEFGSELAAFVLALRGTAASLIFSTGGGVVSLAGVDLLLLGEQGLRDQRGRHTYPEESPWGAQHDVSLNVGRLSPDQSRVEVWARYFSLSRKSKERLFRLGGVRKYHSVSRRMSAGHQDLPAIWRPGISHGEV
jgi:hypothetical protein